MRERTKTLKKRFGGKTIRDIRFRVGWAVIAVNLV
jgi:hypothetical protein